MVAQFDDQTPLLIQDKGLEVEKPRLVIINYGRHAWIDNVKVWKGELSENWAAKREKLNASRNK